MTVVYKLRAAMKATSRTSLADSQIRHDRLCMQVSHTISDRALVYAHAVDITNVKLVACESPYVLTHPKATVATILS